MVSQPGLEHTNQASKLERTLTEGHFAVAAELSPPRGVNIESILKDGETLREYTDAVNVTDNQGASVRMSSIAVSSILERHGIEPVAQMTCRDRNRLAIQADLLGAAGLGIRNLLCISGDHGKYGDHPAAKNVFDIDSTQLLRIVRNLVDHGCMDNGKSINPAPKFFSGAASNPFAPPYEYRPYRLAKKIAAGAKFIQTQLIFNVDRFKHFMKEVVDLGLDEQVYILAGIGPIKSVSQARFMATHIAGMDVPDEIIHRMAAKPKALQPEEGIRICGEIIDQVREIKGISGLHIMAVHWANAVPEIVTRAGLFPRPF